MGGGQGCFQPLLPVVPSLGTYQLVVIDNDQLHVLRLTVHCRVAPADLGGWGGTWNRSPPCLALWPSRGQTGEAGLQPGTMPAPHWHVSHPSPALVVGLAAPVSPPWGHM